MFGCNQFLPCCSNVVIKFHPIVHSDHHFIEVNTFFNLSKVNIGNVLRNFKIDSHKLEDEEFLYEWKAKLESEDISNLNLFEIGNIVKKDLSCKVKKDHKHKHFYVHSVELIALKSARRICILSRQSTEAKNISKLISQIVNKNRRKKQMAVTKDICQNKSKYLTKWWRLSSRFMKPFSRENKLMTNENGVRSY